MFSPTCVSVNGGQPKNLSTVVRETCAGKELKGRHKRHRWAWWSALEWPENG